MHFGRPVKFFLRLMFAVFRGKSLLPKVADKYDVAVEAAARDRDLFAVG
jgi:hypothetical protein